MFTTTIAPDYRRLVAAAKNQRPAIMPLYEHIVSHRVIEELTGEKFSALIRAGNYADGFKIYNDFFRRAGYDAVCYEFCLGSILPGGGAIVGGKAGPIQSRSDLEKYPWATLPDRYWDKAAPQFAALGENLPAGMKAVGGVGNGAFELSEDLCGLEYLPFLAADDPDAYADLYKRIGDLMATVWEKFLRNFGDIYGVCRFGDDLGFRSSLLTMPDTVRRHIIPQYRRVIDLVHQTGKPFLLHSCGCIFEVMDDLIAAGIDAKHSNEDGIAPFGNWIEKYGSRIGLFGGIDVDVLVRSTPDQIREIVATQAQAFRTQAHGFALGTGNSIPDYVPAENYLAMLEAGNRIREAEAKTLP
jgi:uroporphyrinogen decarboxylase